MNDIHRLHAAQKEFFEQKGRIGYHRSADDLYSPCQITSIEENPKCRIEKLGFILLAGGQSTRMKLDPHFPKALIPVTHITKKTIIQLFFEKMLSYQYLSTVEVHLALFVSVRTRDTIDLFLQEHSYFGFPKERISYMIQPSLPLFQEDGTYLRNQEEEIVTGPDGNGSLLYTMKKEGIFDLWKSLNIQYATVAQIDNPLLNPFHKPMLQALYYHDIVFTTVQKRSDNEKVGLFVKNNRTGQIEIREYSELETFQNSLEKPYTLSDFQYANISQSAFQLSWAENIHNKPLPWHIAHKESEGRVYCKMEQFFFDTLRYAKNPALIPIDRGFFFSPIKQQTGIDSLEEAQKNLQKKDENIFQSIFPHRDNKEYSLELHPFWEYFLLEKNDMVDRSILQSIPSSGYIPPIFMKVM